MDQGGSNKAIEGPMDQKAIKVVMDREQAMDQGVRYGWIREHDRIDVWSCDGSESKGWIKDKQLWIREQEQ